MAGITFNIIIIRVHQDRLRLTDSLSTADTGDANMDGALSALPFRSAHSTTNHTAAESQATDQVNEEHRAEKDDHAEGRLKFDVCLNNLSY
jgi:hypothetical protein